jgi:hypothetical protein
LFTFKHISKSIHKICQRIHFGNNIKESIHYYNNKYYYYFIFMIILIVYLYLFFGLILVFLNRKLPREYFALIIFFMFKMLFNYRKCTISYIECKLRNVKKEQGYLNSFIDSILNLRYTPHVYLMYILSAIILYYHFVLKK